MTAAGEAAPVVKAVKEAEKRTSDEPSEVNNFKYKIRY